MIAVARISHPIKKPEQKTKQKPHRLFYLTFLLPVCSNLKFIAEDQHMSSLHVHCLIYHILFNLI